MEDHTGKKAHGVLDQHSICHPGKSIHGCHGFGMPAGVRVGSNLDNASGSVVEIGMYLQFMAKNMEIFQ